MLGLSGYRLYSLAVGGKYARTFLIHDVRGVIADYALGECGAPESPFPPDFFTKVTMAENAVELTDDDGTHRFVVTRDKAVYSQHTASRSADFEESEIEKLRARAKHLMTGALRFLQGPKFVFFGIVWDYVKASTKERERYKHPAAEFLAKRMLKIEFDSKEYPAEVATRVVFRRRLQESVVQRGRDDYINAILQVRDEKLETLWQQEAKPSDDPSSEQPRASAISMDVQRFFDPRRPLDKQIFETHWDYCSQSISPRLSSLLREFEFGSEAQK